MIETLNQSTEGVWENYVLRHPHSTPYHRLYWKELFQTIFGYEACHLFARSGTEVLGCLPLFTAQSLRGPFLVSIPFRDRADPLFHNLQTLGALIEQAKVLMHEKKCRCVLIKSVTALPAEIMRELGLTSHPNWVRSYLPLTGFDAAALWNTINDKTRNMIRQGERAGLEFFSQCTDDQDHDSAIDVLHDTQHRLGIPPFPRAFYAQLLHSLRHQHAGQLCVVKHRGAIVAAAILLQHHTTMIYAYAGSRQSAWPYRVNDFMIWNCLTMALSQGMTSFDFGADSQHQSHVLFFKKKWRASQTPVYSYYAARHAHDAPTEWRDSSQGAYPFLRGMVRRLPDPLYNLIGYFTRYFG